MAITRRKFLEGLGIGGLTLTAGAAPGVIWQLLEGRSENRDIGPSSGEDLDERISGVVRRESTRKPGKAIVINGDGSDFYHMRNLLRAQKFLLGSGYGVDDITVLSPPLEAFPNRDAERLLGFARNVGIDFPSILGPATRNNVMFQLAGVVQRVGADEELFVYLTGHGGRQDDFRFLGLNN